MKGFVKTLPWWAPWVAWLFCTLDAGASRTVERAWIAAPYMLAWIGAGYLAGRLHKRSW